MRATKKSIENLKAARALKVRSESQRAEGLGLAGASRTDMLRTQLYHAASAFELFQESSARGVLREAMGFADCLEAAADAWARR